MTKDEIIALSQYALLWYEELDTMSPSELNQLKAVVTMQYTNERAAYGHYAEQRKHINTFCGTGVKMKGDPVMPFCEALRKWLVAMIAGWIDEGAVNNVILVFIGRQGAYKTTWFNYLLPPELKQYFYTKANARRMTKDDIIALSQYALICYEELDTMSPSELNQLKAVVTMQYTNERAAYGHYAEQRKHINTFCGTGNNPEFLSDPTGNRRWLPYEIESILSPREHPFNYEGIYAQAYALYKSDFHYWFTDEEIEKQNRHNRAFEAPRLEQELVDLYFRKPTEAETGEFVSIARAMQIISCNISQKLNSSKLGKAFNDLGFEKMRTKHSRGYRAIVRTAEEIKAYQVSVCINPREHPFNYEGIYAQAYALYKSDFRYWFTDEEIEKQNRHNRAVEAPRLEQELVDLYFRKPTEAERGEFVSIARAMQIISCKISQKQNSTKLGKAFNELGFEKMRTKHSRCYRSIVRTAEEIKAYHVSVCINPPQCDYDAPF